VWDVYFNHVFKEAACEIHVILVEGDMFYTFVIYFSYHVCILTECAFESICFYNVTFKQV